MKRATLVVLSRVLSAVVSAFALAPQARAQAIEFAPPRDLRVGEEPQAIAVGDFNGDGRPDLAIGGAESGEVLILLGDGAGVGAGAGAGGAVVVS